MIHTDPCIQSCHTCIQSCHTCFSAWHTQQQMKKETSLPGVQTHTHGAGARLEVACGVTSIFLLSMYTICAACRCIRMALVHDIAESLVGDITPHCNVSQEEKHRLEAEAIEQINGMLGAGTDAGVCVWGAGEGGEGSAAA